MGEPIAVIGSACRFAGDSNTPSQLWELLCNPKDVATSVPASRFGSGGFYHEKSGYHGHSNVEGMKSYFLSQEAVERRFDAGFFGINPAEAKVLDPQLRLLTIGVLTAVGNHGELDMHIRAALRAGVSADTIGEVLLHTALYAGVPNSNHGFALLDAAVTDTTPDSSDVSIQESTDVSTDVDQEEDS